MKKTIAWPSETSAPCRWGPFFHLYWGPGSFQRLVQLGVTIESDYSGDRVWWLKVLLPYVRVHTGFQAKSMRFVFIISGDWFPET